MQVGDLSGEADNEQKKAAIAFNSKWKRQNKTCCRAETLASVLQRRL